MASKDLATTSAEDKVMVASTELKAGALHLPEVLMQSVTTIAPAIAALFFTPFLVSFAGVTSPLAYPIAFVITLMLGIVLVQFTKKMPAAGGYYTYISRSIHPRAGWMYATAVYPLRAYRWWHRVDLHGQHPAAGTTGELGYQLALVYNRIYDCDCHRRCPSPVPWHHDLR